MEGDSSMTGYRIKKHDYIQGTSWNIFLRHHCVHTGLMSTGALSLEVKAAGA
jgi:hypothetical protein